jgi:ubiquinone/menaquinone biosynthesis C-methylase UbiE
LRKPEEDAQYASCNCGEVNMVETNPLKTYPALVARLREASQGDAAMEAAVGGDFITVGKLELALLHGLGLRPDHFVVDVGCGSGRLALQLSTITGLRYLGTDIVPDLLSHARKLSKREDWTLVQTDGVQIPCDDNSVDFVCFFSVLTHLTHEDSFRYLREARRVLVPGGRVVLSFLEFHIYSHWAVFELTLNSGTKVDHLNQFMSRDGIAAWADHLNMSVEQIHDGDKPHIDIHEDLVWHDGRVMSGRGCLGQSVAILRKP